MDDQELRDKLAAEAFPDGIHYRSAFRDGWDAASVHLEEKMAKMREAVDNYPRMVDNLIAESERKEVFYATKLKIFDMERSLITNMCEELARALEYAKKDPTWYANLTSKASLTLAKWRRYSGEKE